MSAGSSTALAVNPAYALKPGIWAHLTVVVRGPTKALTASVSVDGTNVIQDAPISSSCESGRILDHTDGVFCAGYANTGGDVELRVDNVLVQALP